MKYIKKLITILLGISILKTATFAMPTSTQVENISVKEELKATTTINEKTKKTEEFLTNLVKSTENEKNKSNENILKKFRENIKAAENKLFLSTEEKLNNINIIINHLINYIPTLLISKDFCKQNYNDYYYYKEHPNFKNFSQCCNNRIQNINNLLTKHENIITQQCEEFLDILKVLEDDDKKSKIFTKENKILNIENYDDVIELYKNDSKKDLKKHLLEELESINKQLPNIISNINYISNNINTLLKSITKDDNKPININNTCSLDDLKLCCTQCKIIHDKALSHFINIINYIKDNNVISYDKSHLENLISDLKTTSEKNYKLINSIENTCETLKKLKLEFINPHKLLHENIEKFKNNFKEKSYLDYKFLYHYDYIQKILTNLNNIYDKNININLTNPEFDINKLNKHIENIMHFVERNSIYLSEKEILYNDLQKKIKDNISYLYDYEKKDLTNILTDMEKCLGLKKLCENCIKYLNDIKILSNIPDKTDNINDNIKFLKNLIDKTFLKGLLKDANDTVKIYTENLKKDPYIFNKFIETIKEINTALKIKLEELIALQKTYVDTVDLETIKLESTLKNYDNLKDDLTDIIKKFKETISSNEKILKKANTEPKSNYEVLNKINNFKKKYKSINEKEIETLNNIENLPFYNLNKGTENSSNKYNLENLINNIFCTKTPEKTDIENLDNVSDKKLIFNFENEDELIYKFIDNKQKNKNNSSLFNTINKKRKRDNKISDLLKNISCSSEKNKLPSNLNESNFEMSCNSNFENSEDYNEQKLQLKKPQLNFNIDNYSDNSNKNNWPANDKDALNEEAKENNDIENTDNNNKEDENTDSDAIYAMSFPNHHETDNLVKDSENKIINKK